MKIAVASGKGGTGKTSFSIALAVAADCPVTFIDCDVEEPNAHLFLRSSGGGHCVSDVSVPIPRLDESKCLACGECSNFCRFNAIAQVKSKPIFFHELCHSCGGCALVCPVGVISEFSHSIGTIVSYVSDNIHFFSGTLMIGRPMATPLIKEVKKHLNESSLCIIDCPPGTSCSMIEAVRDTDFIILVTEPTPFGLHDLTLAVETVRMLNIPFGVIINCCDSGDDSVENFCRRENIPVLLQVEENRAIAQAYSVGIPMNSVIDGLNDRIKDMFSKVSRIITEKL